MLRGSNRSTAIFASNDDMALGVSAANANLDAAVPTELSIAGFDEPSRRRHGSQQSERLILVSLALGLVE